jgi:small conductance mechanosensitive channel
MSKLNVWNRKQVRRFILCNLGILIVLMITVFHLPLTAGQLPTLPTTNGAQTLPPKVERRGTLEVTGVRMDGKELIRIASPAVFNRNEPGAQIPVEVRARQVEANLEQILGGGRFVGETTLDPNTLQVIIEPIDDQPVLFATDATSTEAKVLLTVTGTDAQYASLSQERLAEQWQVILEQELRQAIELRQPEVLQQRLTRVITALVFTVLLTMVSGAGWAYLGRRKQKLEQRLRAELAAIANKQPPAIAPVIESGGFPFFQTWHHHFTIQRRLQIIRFLRWLLFWTVFLAWILLIAYSLNAFPATRFIARKIAAIPIVILVVWFLMGLIDRLTSIIIDRVVQNWEQDQSLTEANLQRMETITNVIKGLKTFLVYVISILWLLQWLNLIPGSIITLGAVVALAISFAAQNLVRDLVNGFLILVEDQYRIGDFVRIDNEMGLVEQLNLRITQIRNPDGNLITLPNSLIAKVENMSRTWARADMQIEVAYDTDVNHALAVVRETIDQMETDPEWRSLILDSHEVFGVEQISHTGILIRVWIKTLPLRQWDVARELRRRLKIAFDRHHIQIGIPQQIWLGNIAVTPEPLNPLPAEDQKTAEAQSPQR